jgi:hypothetical protein
MNCQTEIKIKNKVGRPMKELKYIPAPRPKGCPKKNNLMTPEEREQSKQHKLQYYRQYYRKNKKMIEEYLESIKNKKIE